MDQKIVLIASLRLLFTMAFIFVLVGVAQVLAESFLGEDQAFLEFVHAFGGDHTLLIDVVDDGLRHLVGLEGQRQLEEPQMGQLHIPQQLLQVVHVVYHQVVHIYLVKLLGLISGPWEHYQVQVRLINDPHFLLTVIERTLTIGIALFVFTALGFIVAGVVLLLLPAVAVVAGSLEHAALLVLADEGARLPVLA